MALLEVSNLSVDLSQPPGTLQAVKDLSLTLQRGETFGIVGESGCGKSMTALAIMGLLPEGASATGHIRLDGEELLEKSEAELCRIRGQRIAMVFQEPMTSLNPVHTIGRQITEPLRLHQGLSIRAAETAAVELLGRVGFTDPSARLDAYPHQFSGGQRQRICIAMALSSAPDILIADEPTTALDVTTQGQILDLINELVDERGLALILISHDLGVISETTDRMLVMYGGQGVETGPTADLFKFLAHPYSQGLFAAMPRIGQLDTTSAVTKLQTIPGTVPPLADLPPGCAFADRCTLADDRCYQDPPPRIAIGTDHESWCHHAETARRHAVTGL